MFPTDDVVNLMGKAGVVFVDEAIFTAVLRTASHLGSQSLADVSGHERGIGGP